MKIREIPCQQKEPMPRPNRNDIFLWPPGFIDHHHCYYFNLFHFPFTTVKQENAELFLADADRYGKFECDP